MYRLPDRWTAPEIVADVISLDELEVHRAGVSTIGEDGEEICGSAAQSGEPALDRAWLELLERVASLEAIASERPSYEVFDDHGERLEGRARSDVFPVSDEPDRWRYARSNGVAVHCDWARAC